MSNKFIQLKDGSELTTPIEIPRLGNAIGMRGWNQLVKNGNFASTDGWLAKSRCTMAVSSNELVMTSTSSGSMVVESSVTFLPNHKYYLSCTAKYSGSTSINFGATIAGGYGEEYGTRGNISNSYTTISSITSGGITQTFTALYLNSSDSSVGDVITVKNVNCIDLTALFGSGNEPSTVAEFRAMFPADYYPYTGITTLINNQVITTTVTTFTVPNISQYKYILISYLFGWASESCSDCDVFLPTSIFQKRTNGVNSYVYTSTYYNCSVNLKYLSDTSISVYVQSINGWANATFNMYGIM